MRLYVTGGHLTPALAVIDYLTKHEPEVEIIFIGREYAQEGGARSHEREEIALRDIPFYAIDAAKFHRSHFWKNLFEIVKLPLSFLQVMRIFHTKRPDAILSFGGYVALPVCMAAKLFSARIVTHEQTKAAGLANQVLARIADVVAVSNEESLKFFPREKTVVTGNPIRESLLRTYKVPPSWLKDTSKSKPLLYVTGGSQGSMVLNQTVGTLVPKLIREYVIVHQCGTSPDSRYLHDLEAIRETLPDELQRNYVIKEWIDAKEVSYLFRTAKFVISRAGANTVEELIFSATPAIFVPLAFAYNDEQQKNIEPLIEAGSSLMILQKDLVPESLYHAIQDLERKYDRLKKSAEQLSTTVQVDGAARVAKLILTGTIGS